VYFTTTPSNLRIPDGHCVAMPCHSHYNHSRLRICSVDDLQRRRMRSVSDGAESVASEGSEARSDDDDSMGADVMGMRAASKGPCGPCGMLMGGVPHIMMLLVDRIVSTVDGWGVDDSGNAVRISL
jgi:hypothetical protein